MVIVNIVSGVFLFFFIFYLIAKATKNIKQILKNEKNLYLKSDKKHGNIPKK